MALGRPPEKNARRRKVTIRLSDQDLEELLDETEALNTDKATLAYARYKVGEGYKNAVRQFLKRMNGDD